MMWAQISDEVHCMILSDFIFLKGDVSSWLSRTLPLSFEKQLKKNQELLIAKYAGILAK